MYKNTVIDKATAHEKQTIQGNINASFRIMNVVPIFLYHYSLPNKGNVLSRYFKSHFAKIVAEGKGCLLSKYRYIVKEVVIFG